jgi:hypothetical protein
LKITRFVGTSENAIRIQIAVALISFLLLRLAQATQKTVTSPLAFARLVRANLDAQTRHPRPARPTPGCPDQSQSAGLSMSKNRTGQPCSRAEKIV